MKYKTSVTRDQKKIKIMSLLAHVSSSLTDKILVPNRSKAQDQQTLNHQCIRQRDESIDISYSSHSESWWNSLNN